MVSLVFYVAIRAASVVGGLACQCLGTDFKPRSKSDDDQHENNWIQYFSILFTLYFGGRKNNRQTVFSVIWDVLNYKNYWGWIWSLWRRWCVLFSERIASNALDLQATKLFGAPNTPRERMIDHDWPLIHNKGRIWTWWCVWLSILIYSPYHIRFSMFLLIIQWYLLLMFQKILFMTTLLDLCDMYIYMYTSIHPSICFMNFIGSTCINDCISQPFTARSRRVDSVCSSPGRTRTSGSLAILNDVAHPSYLPCCCKRNWKKTNTQTTWKT